MVRGLASREGHPRWVEDQENEENYIIVDKEDGDNRDGGYGGDYGASKGPWLPHDTNCALQDYWGKAEADGNQVDRVAGCRLQNKNANHRADRPFSGLFH